MSFFLLLLYLAAFLLRLEEQFPSLAPYPIMYVLGIAVSLASLLEVFAGKRPTLRAPQIYLMVALTVMIPLSVVFTGWFGGAVLALEEFGTTTIVFFLLVLNITSMYRLRVVAAVLVVLTIFLASQGILAYHWGYQEGKFILNQPVGAAKLAMDLEQGQRFSADGELVVLPRIRSLGLLNDPNDLAQMLLLVIPFIWLAWKRNHWIRNLVVVGAPLAFLVYSIYLTRSRGGILGLLVLSLLAWKWRVGKTTALAMTVVLAIVLLGLNFSGGRGFSDGSAEGRMDAWSEGLQMLKANPFSGVGYGGFLEYHERTAHNSFVLCFAELGLAGYFLWLALVVITLVQLHALGRNRDDDPDSEILSKWGRAIFVALGVFLAAALFLSRTYILTLYILLALGTALVDIARRSEVTVTELPPLRWFSRIMALEFASIVVIYVAVRLNPV